MVTDTVRSSDMPDAYDRQLSALHEVFIVQTYRQRERGDTIFLEVVGVGGAVRLVIPPAVSNTIARQRDALTARSRSQTAKAVAADRKARGIEPGFMTNRPVRAVEG